MNRLSLISIIIGIVVIIFRAPFVIKPEAAMKYFSEKLASNTKRIRFLGLLLIGMCSAVIFVTWGSGLLIGEIIVSWVAVIAIFLTFLMVIFPGAYKQILIYFSEVDSSVLRGIGVIGVAVGTIFLYLGFAVFWS